MRREDPKFIEKRKKFYAEQKQKSQDKFSKGGLSPKQKVIAAKAPPPDKITGADFAALKKEKVMKAKRGKFLRSDTTKPISSVKAKTGKTDTIKFLAKKKGLPMPLKTIIQENKIAEAGKKAAKATRVGKILLPIVGAGVAAQQFLKSKMKKDKKMGGGMMKKYSKGGGADTGSEGEDRSALGVIENKLKRYGDSLKRLKKRPKLQAPERGPMIPLAKSNESKTSAVKLIERSLKELKGDVKGSLKPFLKKRKEKNTVMEGSNVALSKVSPRMGGGMMNKPMGYKSGKSIKVKCKLGKNKPTKMY